uniref:Uncharacterized protein n=1 Tax=Gossypium raimondii TaxID=29730 RepID=A0A0D2RNU5_GOSRA|nr:hypothetical protein B456_011G172400 [Gossypium raimondii]
MKNKGRVLKRESERESMNERMRVQDALKGNSIEITEDSLLGLKYDPASIWGYFEQLHIEQGPVLELVGFPLTVVKGIATQTGMKMMKQRHKVEREANIMPKLDGRRIRKLPRYKACSHEQEIWNDSWVIFTCKNFQIHLFTSVDWVECWLHTFRLNVSVF